jgi:transcriptional regulator with XRE-family HTH domain
MDSLDGDYSAEVAKNVKKLREKRRLTRKELSEAVGGSHSYIFHVEELQKMPSLLMGLRIARVLKVAPESLLE